MAKKPAEKPGQKPGQRSGQKPGQQSRTERARALQQQQARKERAGKAAIVGGVVVLAVVLVVALFLVLRSSDTTGEAADRVPANTTDDYGVVVGESDAPTEITLYEDLQCPICAQFEELTGSEVEQGLEQGNIRVEYRLVAFLDGQSSNNYSSRAMNAALAVLDTAGPEAFKEFHDALFANQPAEGGPGPEDEQLIDEAVAAGAEEDAVRPQIEDKVYEQWIANATDAMSKNDVTGTPTVFIDGERKEDLEKAARDVVAAAAGSDEGSGG